MVGQFRFPEHRIMAFRCQNMNEDGKTAEIIQVTLVYIDISEVITSRSSVYGESVILDLTPQ